jgi:hypothetical protein
MSKLNDLMMHTSQLKKGINYRKEYVKSGGYSTDDPNSAFYEKFRSTHDIRAFKVVI